MFWCNFDVPSNEIVVSRTFRNPNLGTVLLTQHASSTKVLVPQVMSVRSSLRHSSPQRFPVAILMNTVDCQLRQLWSHRLAIVKKDM